MINSLPVNDRILKMHGDNGRDYMMLDASFHTEGYSPINILWLSAQDKPLIELVRVEGVAQGTIFSPLIVNL